MLTMRHDETGSAPSLGRQKQGSQTHMIPQAQGHLDGGRIQLLLPGEGRLLTGRQY